MQNYILATLYATHIISSIHIFTALFFSGIRMITGCKAFFWKIPLTKVIQKIKIICTWCSHRSALQHPACSPGLAPSDFHLLPKLKEFLGGRARRRNRLTMHFSEHIHVIKRHMTVVCSVYA